jgi:hypothetical protein
MRQYHLDHLIVDYYHPHGVRQAILIVNDLYLKQLPLFLLLPLTVIFNPLRLYWFFSDPKLCFVSYSTHKHKAKIVGVLLDLKSHEADKRTALFISFKESLTDFLSFVAGVLITVTGFRAIYLIAILSVNGHLTCFNGFLTSLTQDRNPKLWIKLQQIKHVMEDPAKKESMHERYISVK